MCQAARPLFAARELGEQCCRLGGWRYQDASLIHWRILELDSKRCHLSCICTYCARCVHHLSCISSLCACLLVIPHLHVCCSRPCVRSAGFAGFLSLIPLCLVPGLASARRGALAVLLHAAVLVYDIFLVISGSVFPRAFAPFASSSHLACLIDP